MKKNNNKSRIYNPSVVYDCIYHIIICIIYMVAVLKIYDFYLIQQFFTCIIKIIS